MYCIHCGHPNAEGSKFCEACGKPIQSAGSVRNISASPSTTSWMKRIPTIGALVVILGFFLPWLLVSCSLDLGYNNSGFKASGYEIATGNYSVLKGLQGWASLLGSDTSSQGNNQDSSAPALWLILGLGILGLFALNGRVSGSVLAILAGILGIVGMAFFSYSLGDVMSSKEVEAFRFQYKEGYWLTWIGFLWLTVTGIMTVRQKR